MSKTYDILLRRLFKTLPIRYPQKVRFLDVKLPKLFEREADLVFEHHIEIQSVDVPRKAYRMLYYYFLIRKNYNRKSKQVVVYVGEKPP